jgi:hypothetical protein
MAGVAYDFEDREPQIRLLVAASSDVWGIEPDARASEYPADLAIRVTDGSIVKVLMARTRVESVAAAPVATF